MECPRVGGIHRDHRFQLLGFHLDPSGSWMGAWQRRWEMGIGLKVQL